MKISKKTMCEKVPGREKGGRGKLGGIGAADELSATYASLKMVLGALQKATGRRTDVPSLHRADAAHSRCERRDR